MTRSDDTYIGLYERAAIANGLGADLFISIHANRYTSSISGGLIAGAVLVAAGVFGIVFNATRDNVKTSR